jgi:N-acetylmuramoyl-L-alanine amidase
MKKIPGIIFCLFLFCSVLKAADPEFVVVIDPGHGGKDGGAVRRGYKEKDINLRVALFLGQLIEKNNKDVKVVYTRKTDVFIALDRRAEIANKAKANLFISIHTNSTSTRTTTAAGSDTYILGLARSEENLEVAKRENSVILLEDDYTTKYEGFDPNSPESYIIFEFMTNKFMEQSLLLANFIQKDFKAVAKRPDRGVRQAGFLVLRKTGMPSILIELGFINNETEVSFLASEKGQQTMATAIYSGFKKYKREFDKKQGEFIVEKDDDITFDTGETEFTKQEGTEAKPTNITPEPQTAQKAGLSGKVEYRVQFMVLSKKLPANSPAFKGLSPVTFYKDAGMYKYTCGSTTNLNEILNIQRRVRTKFKDAFVVKFRDGERIN